MTICRTRYKITHYAGNFWSVEKELAEREKKKKKKKVQNGVMQFLIKENGKEKFAAKLNYKRADHPLSISLLFSSLVCFSIRPSYITSSIIYSVIICCDIFCV